MRLTLDILAADYELLRATRPFRGWRLPPANTLRFKVVKTPSRHGRHVQVGSDHTIEISKANVGTLSDLDRVMAHEMVHLYEGLHPDGAKSEHGARFRRLAKSVCKAHHWAEEGF